MVTRRCRLVWGIIVLCATTFACGEPPDKEVQQAQGAIDAARAAGAEQYARDEFAAATEALQRAHEATRARDYRLALNHALDSRERANNAAREAADNKAAAQTAADRVLSTASSALTTFEQRLADAESRRPPIKLPPGPRETATSATGHLQEARSAFDRGDFAAATTAATAVSEALADAQRALDVATAPAPRRAR